MVQKKLVIRNSSGYVQESLDGDRIDGLIFSDQYKDALESIDRYCGRGNKGVRNKDLGADNIFAFIGERGSGKTSCLISVMHSILDGKYDKQRYHNIAQTGFTSIDIIDPSFLDTENNIVGLFIAKLYKEFINEDDRRLGNQNMVVRNELLHAFMAAQRSYKYLFGGQEKDHDDLDNLELLSVAVDLRKSLHRLVSAYNKYMPGKNDKLLIAIDDLDLYSKCATAISEEIRRYLTLDNVVILISIKLSQLTVLKTQGYIHDYQCALDNDIVMLPTVEKMAEHYVTKLLPYAHRVFMPAGEVYGDMMMAFDDKPENVALVRQRIPELIFEKTRYLFYNSSVQTSYIVPTNLRELCQLAQMLHAMHPYCDEPQNDPYGNGHETGNEYNKLKFKKYFTETWAANHFSKATEREIQPLLDVKEMMQYNAAAIKVIYHRFADIVDHMIDLGEDSLITAIFDKANKSYNISLGDVVYVLRSLEPMLTDMEDRYILFFIKNVYSIQLYEAYDRMTADKGIKDGRRQIVLRNKPIKGKDTSDYHKLVGGAFIACDRYGTPIPPRLIDGGVRSPRPLNILVFNKVIDYMLGLDKIPGNLLRLIELFILCISRPFDSKSRDSVDYIDPNFRRKGELWYTDKFVNPVKKNGVFDVTSFLFNITRVQECFSRFYRGTEILDKMGANQDQSLYFDFLKACNIKDPQQMEHQWLSKACIRNIEVLCDLLDSIQVEGDSDDMKTLSKYFANISRYNIPTYKLTPESDPGIISYFFARQAATVLRDTSLKDVFDLIFNSKEIEVRETYAFMEIDPDTATRGMFQKDPEKTNIRDTYIERLKKIYWDGWSDEVRAEFNAVFDLLRPRIKAADMKEAVEEFNKRVIALREKHKMEKAEE